MEKKSKIEKLVFAGDLIENELERIRIKINKIIDYLNTQPQAEEGTNKCFFCGEETDGWEDTDGHSTCEECVIKQSVERIKEIKDTPEEWVEKLWELIDVYRDSKDINSELEGIEEVNQYVKQLLDEREIFTKKEWLMLKFAMNEIHNEGNNAYDEISEKIKKELDKLNK